MQLPIELQVYTKCSGHGTLEGLGCEDRAVAPEKKGEHQRGHGGRRDLVLGFDWLLIYQVN